MLPQTPLPLPDLPPSERPLEGPSAAPPERPDSAEQAFRRALNARDVTAWSLLMDRAYPELVRQAGGVLPRGEDPRDAASETFYRAYLAADRYDPQFSPTPWLATICAHECLRCCRSRRRRIRRSTGAARPEEPPEAVESAEAREAMRIALRRLRGRERQVVVLRFTFRLSIREIASALSLRESVVERTVSRGLCRLRKGPEARDLKEWLSLIDGGKS